MDSSFSGRKNITHMAQKYDTTEFIPLPFPDQDLPNHNQPQACARVPWAGPRASRPGRHRARTPRAGRLQVTGGRASPRPRGPGSPPAQRCAPGPSSPAHAAESRPETQRLEQRVQGRSPAGLRGPWAPLLAERPGLLPTADLSAPAKARFLCGGATPPSPPRTPFPPPPPRPLEVLPQEPHGALGLGHAQVHHAVLEHPLDTVLLDVQLAALQALGVVQVGGRGHGDRLSAPCGNTNRRASAWLWGGAQGEPASGNTPLPGPEAYGCGPAGGLRDRATRCGATSHTPRQRRG